MSVSTKQLVQTYGYELVFYDDRGADKKAFANHECKVIGIGSYLEEKEKKRKKLYTMNLGTETIL